MGQIKYISSLLMISLFAIAIVSYAINFGEDNDAHIKLGDDSNINTLNLNLKSDIDTYRVTSNASGESLFSNIIEPQEVTTKKGTPLKNLLSIFTSFQLIGNTIIDKIFGGKGGGFGVIFTGFFALISLIGLLYAYKTWIGRNPD